VIYFAQSRTTRLIKIGTTECLRTRLPELRQQADGEVDVLGVTDGSFAEETSLHQHFQHLHVKGEWFRPEAELRDFIEQNTRAWDGQKLRRMIALPPSLYQRLSALAKKNRRPLQWEAIIAIETHLEANAPADDD